MRIQFLILNDYRSTDIKAIVRVNLKDKVKYEDDSLNLISKFEELDELVKIEGAFLEMSNGITNPYGMALGQNLFLIRIPGLLFQSSGERKKQETK